MLGQAPAGSVSRRVGAFGSILCCLILVLAIMMAPVAWAQSPPRIGILQLVEHPALDDSRIGFLEAIEEAGYKVGEDIVVEYHNAQNDMSVLRAIAESFVNSGMDLIYAIATPPVQTVANLTKDIPILFAAVRDPIAAQVVESFERPGGNITGTSHWTPVSAQIKLVQELIPGVQRVGVIYNAGEVNARVQVEDAREWAQSVGITLVERTVSNTSEVQQAAQSLVGQASIIYVPTDNTVVAALESLLTVAERFQIPVVAADMSTAERGAVAAYGADFLQLGRQAGRMALRILFEGADPATMPVEFQEEQDLALNLGAAKRMGLTIPSEVLEKARYLYE